MHRSEIADPPTDRSEIPTRLVYTVPEVAVLLGGVTERYVWKLISAGELNALKIGKRRVVERQALDTFIAKLREDELLARAAASSEHVVAVA